MGSSRSVWQRAALTIAAAAALAGCAPAEAVPSVDGAPTDGDQPVADLTITMRGVNGYHGVTATFTLTCGPVGGDLPSAIAACGNLLADFATGADPFAPAPTGAACRDVIEGPGLISVRGTWADTPVQAQFDQVDSCQNERFQRFLATLGVS